MLQRIKCLKVELASVLFFEPHKKPQVYERLAWLNPLMLWLRPVPCATHAREKAPIERLRASRTAPE